MKDRIEQAFKALNGKKALVTFLTAGDPDYETSRAILHALPDAGADIIELGMPFSDPTADGPTIESAYVRSLKGGHVMSRTLDMCRSFRALHKNTPLVLFGYFNPVNAYGVDKFLDDAESAGVDGFLMVDLPAERDATFCDAAVARGFAMIRLVAPTTPQAKHEMILRKASGFVYNIAISGITGTKSATQETIRSSVAALKKGTKVPVATGFGIKTPEQAKEAAQASDAVVVGSAIVERIGKLSDLPEAQRKDKITEITDFVRSLSDAVRAA